MTGASEHPAESTEPGTPPIPIEHVRWSGPPIPQLRKPMLITAFKGWNDAGDAATMAARHLIVRWGCKTIADIDPELFYDFTSTRPTVHIDKRPGKEEARILKWPSNKVKAARLPQADADVVVLIGVEPQHRWRTFGEQVIAVADALGVRSVVSMGALLAEVPHNRPVEVYGSAEDEAMKTEFRLSPSMYEGPTGIVGVLTAACRDAGYTTASLWAAVPAYMPGAPSPKAALALVKRVGALVRAPVAYGNLKRAAMTYEREIDKLVANDEEMSAYVNRLEKTWEAEHARKVHRDTHSAQDDDTRSPLQDDPETLVAEVEQFLRDAD